MTRRVITIRDVASLAGVSVSTVSNALSGQRSVSRSTRLRIQAAAHELGYRPNTAAHSLRTGIHHTIGLVVPDITNPFFADIAHGAETAAQALGWSVLLANSELDGGREEAYLDRLAATSDGILFFPTSTRTERIQALVDKNVAVVICDERIDVIGAGGVFSDNVTGGRLAAAHLISRGARRIAVIGGPVDLPTSIERLSGFMAGIRAARRSVPASRIVPARYTIEDGLAAATGLLAADPKIDAIFCADDLQAIGASQALASAGRAVPQDVLLCGFDGIFWGLVMRPTLTTISQNSHQIGAEAARLLIQMVSVDSEPREIVLSVTLEERESTDRH